MSAADRAVGIENIGVFIPELILVCCNTDGVVLVFEIPNAEGNTDLTGAIRNKCIRSKSSFKQITYQDHYDIFLDIFWHILLELEQILAMKMV